MAAMEFNIEPCRICMEKHAINMCNIFDSDVIPEQILFCTGVSLQNEHELPTKMCPRCLKDLAVAHRFKTLCLVADETFRKQIAQAKMKVEIEVFTSAPGPDFTSCEDGFEDWFNDEIKEEVKDEDIFEDMSRDGHENIKENITKPKPTRNVRSKKKTVKSLTVKEVKLKSKVTKSRSKKTTNKKAKVKKEVKLKEKKVEKRSKVNDKDNEENIDILDKKTESVAPKKLVKGRRKLRLKYRKLYCERCDLQFDSREASDAHKKEFHNKLEEWVCEICGKVIMHRGIPYGHIKSHTPPCYQCAHCDYKTYFKPSLRTHMAFHTRERKFQCEYCAKMFLTASSRKGHIRAVHLLERKHKCELCGKSFFTKTKLNMHIDGHNAIKRYECEICHSAFTRREYWKKHLLDQHGIAIARARPGRQTTNAMVGEDLININNRRELVMNKVDTEV